MENIDKIQQVADLVEATSQTKTAITWHDLSLGLWAALITLALAFIKFIRWFSTREVKRFWEDIDSRLESKIKASNEELEKKVEEKFTSRDNSIKEIRDGVIIIRKHYHDKNAMEAGVLSQLLTATEHLTQKMSNDTSKLKSKDLSKVSSDLPNLDGLDDFK